MFFLKSESKKEFFSTYRSIFNIILVNKMDSLSIERWGLTGR